MLKEVQEILMTEYGFSEEKANSQEVVDLILKEEMVKGVRTNVGNVAAFLTGNVLGVVAYQVWKRLGEKETIELTASLYGKKAADELQKDYFIVHSGSKQESKKAIMKIKLALLKLKNK